MKEFSKKYEPLYRNAVAVRISQIFDQHATFSVKLHHREGQGHRRIIRAMTPILIGPQGTKVGSRHHRAVRMSEPWVLAHIK